MYNQKVITNKSSKLLVHTILLNCISVFLFFYSIALKSKQTFQGICPDNKIFFYLTLANYQNFIFKLSD